MADEIVIRIEDGDEDQDNLNSPDLQSSAAQTTVERVIERTPELDRASSQVTMESLFGEEPWWLDSRYQGNDIGSQPRVEYPSAVDPEDAGDECECSEYFERMIALLTQIEVNTDANSGTNVNNNTTNNTNNTNNANNNSSAVTNAINRFTASMNISNAVNSPINATANIIGSIGNIFANIASQLTATVVTGLLAPILGPIAPIVGQMVGMLVGGAITQFFNALSEGLRNFFEFVDRMVDSTAAFSPQVMNASIDREMRLLDLSMATGKIYGGELADSYNAETDLIIAIEALKLEIFSTFAPVVTELAKHIALILQVVRVISIGMDFSEIVRALNKVMTAADVLPGLIPTLTMARMMLNKIVDHLDKAERARQAEEERVGGEIQRDFARQFGWI